MSATLTVIHQTGRSVYLSSLEIRNQDNSLIHKECCYPAVRISNDNTDPVYWRTAMTFKDSERVATKAVVRWSPSINFSFAAASAASASGGLYASCNTPECGRTTRGEAMSARPRGDKMIFRFVLKSPVRHQPQYRGIERCFPACYVPAGVEPLEGSSCACRSASPWFDAWYEFHKPSDQVRWPLPMGGRFGHIVVSIHGGTLKRGSEIGVAPASVLPSQSRQRRLFESTRSAQTVRAAGSFVVRPSRVAKSDCRA